MFHSLRRASSVPTGGFIALMWTLRPSKLLRASVAPRVTITPFEQTDK